MPGTSGRAREGRNNTGMGRGRKKIFIHPVTTMLFSGPIDFTRDYEARKIYIYIYINIHIYIKRDILYINIIINIIVTHREGEGE